jgi:hypothetical protein
VESGAGKVFWVAGVVKNEKIFNQSGERQGLELRRYAQRAAIGRYLEDTIGFRSGFIRLLAIMMIARVFMACGLNLVKKMMHPVRRGIDNKK